MGTQHVKEGSNISDNVNITPGSGNVVGADEVVDGTLGTVKIQYVKIMDGTIDGTAKAAVGANGLKVDGSAVTQPISASSLPLPTGAATETTLAAIKTDTDKFTFASTRLVVDGSQVTQPVSGTITITPSGTQDVNIVSSITLAISAASLPLPTGAATEATLSAINGKIVAVNTGAVTISSALPAGTNVIGHVITDTGSVTAVSNFPATQPVSGTVTANIGTSGSLALDASVVALQVAQGSTTSGQKGSLVLGAVTTAAPTYTTAQTSPLSLDTSGNLRVTNTPSGTQTITGTVTANAGTNLNTSLLALESGGNLATIAGAVSSAKMQTNVAQLAGTTTDTNSGNKSAGTLRVVIATDQPQLTNALKVDGSAVTQPVSGTVTANAGTNLNTSLLLLDSTFTGRINTLGQKTMANSTPVVLASDQTSIPVAGVAAQGASVSGNPVLIGLEARDTLGTVVATGQVVRGVADRYGRQYSIEPSVTYVSSAATPITTNTNTSTVAAPGAGNHLRIYRISAENSSSTATWMYWTEGSGGTKKFAWYLTQGSARSLNLVGSWNLPSATALFINTATTGANIEWNVGYETVAD